MNIRDFQTAIPYMFKSELTPFVWGHAGVGKTEVVRKYAKENGYHFFALYLGAQSDVGDILGLADFIRDEKGNPVATTFATPKWLKDAIDYCNNNPDSGAVIFLDEFNRARRDILNAMFSLALDKTFHTIKLPKNCHIIAAGNPPTAEYVTTDVDETALMARFVHIKLEPTIEEWIEYAKGAKLDNNIVEFVRQQPELLEDKRQTFKLPVKADRRAWSRLNKLMELNTPDDILEQLMVGIIGLERTVAYKEFLKNQDKPLTGEQVLSGKHLKLVKKWCGDADVKASLVNLTCENVVAVMKEYDTATKVLDKSEMKSLYDFFTIIPKDIAFKTFLDLNAADSKSFQAFYTNETYEEKLVELAKTIRGAQPKAG